MTLNEWTQNEKCVTWTRHLLDSPQGKLFMQVLHEAHAKNGQLPHTDSLSIKATELGIIYGYDRCLNNIEAMGVMTAPTVAIEETYESEK